MVIETLEITRNRIDLDCKDLKPADENMIQTVESRGRKKKRNKIHNNWKTQNKIREIRLTIAVITININGLNSLIEKQIL